MRKGVVDEGCCASHAVCRSFEALAKAKNLAARDYATRHFELVADLHPDRLVEFLHSDQGQHTSLDTALAVCRAKSSLKRALVFVERRTGNSEGAMKLLMEDLADVRGAIELAKEINDDGTWDQLLTFSRDKPQFIKGLLDNVGTHMRDIVAFVRVRAPRRVPRGCPQLVLSVPSRDRRASRATWRFPISGARS